MKFTAAQIASYIDGEIIGDSKTLITDFGKIETAGANSLTFLADEKYKSYLHESQAAIVVISKKISIPTESSQTFIQVKNAYIAMATLLNIYQKSKPQKTGKEEPCYIDESAQLGNNIYIGAFAYIGKNVMIGENVKIYPHAYIGDNVEIKSGTTIYAGVKIYEDCKVGENCTLHAGSVIGSDGFGFQPDEQGVFHKIPQIGNVIIEDNVEIGAACTIDRATMGSTIIKKGVKLDNQIQIAHNVSIGENTVIASQTGVAGSTKIGKNNMIGGQVGIAGHLTIGDFVQVQAQSGIGQNIESKKQLYGSPAFDAMEFRKSYVYFRKLPQLVRKIDLIEKNLNKED